CATARRDRGLGSSRPPRACCSSRTGTPTRWRGPRRREGARAWARPEHGEATPTPTSGRRRSTAGGPWIASPVAHATRSAAMSKQRDVAVIVGSLRKDSLNRKMARSLEQLAPEHLRTQIVEIRDLALYDQDLEASPPAPWVTFR